MTKSTIPTTSTIPNQDRLEILKSTFPEAFTEGKIDLEKLKAALGEDLASGKERYNFTWAGKRDAIGILQIPTRATLVPAPEESINFDTTQNIFIEGDNLEVLKLLYKSYFGRVKLIYIDPPYNTGNDFIYPDNYTDPIETYLQISGQKDAEGNLLTSNPETSGRYHSAWLSMMYPRLFLARQLLSEDGVLLISIDDIEYHNLRALVNEIFGEENFVDNIVWKKRYGGGSKEKHLVSLHEYILFFAKNINNLPQLFVPLDEESISKYYRYKDEKYPIRGPYRTHPLEATKSMGDRKNLIYSIPAPDGQNVFPKRQWLWSKERAYEALRNNDLAFFESADGWSIHTKQYLKDENGLVRQSKAFSIIEDIYTQHGTNEIIDLFNDAQVFPFPKPSELIKKLINIVTDDGSDDIIMDFFSGASSTAHAVLEINKEDHGKRKFIVVQLPEPSGNSDFLTIADIGKERIRRVIKKLQVPENSKQPSLPMENKDFQMDLGFRVYKLAESNFKPWVGVQEKDPETYMHQMQAFNDALVEGWTVDAVLTELAIKHGLCLTYQVEKIAILGETVYQLTDSDKEQSLFVCLDSHIDLAAFNELKLDKETIFICLDSALDDETAANLALVCRLETI